MAGKIQKRNTSAYYGPCLTSRGEPSSQFSYSLANATLLPRYLRNLPNVLAFNGSPLISCCIPSFLPLPPLPLLTSLASLHNQLTPAYYCQFYLVVYFKMRLYRFLVIIALLMGIAHCFYFFDTMNPAPTSTALNQPKSASKETLAEVEGHVENIQSRGFTQNTDYKCGSKWGRCPMGTCCSASGKSQSRSTNNVLTRIWCRLLRHFHVALPLS